MRWLNDQIAVVTGGGSGLGLAIVETFLDEGACLVVLERSPQKCAELRQNFDESRLCVVEGDATVFADNAAAVTEALRRHGRLDCFVANAGLWDFARPLEDMSAEQLSAAFDEIYALNVKAPLLGAKASLAPLRASGGSYLVSLSNAALFPGGGGTLYVSSKHAGVGLVKQLAYELAPEIRVNGVAPGGMATDLRGPKSLGLADTAWNSLPVEDILTAHTPMQRAPQPAEYAGAYALLASRRFGTTATGTVLDVCGGMGIIGTVAERKARQ
ncbi:3-(cis-5,6-dihydroxycyclohexa-1,3-dien-1-yl)propanoate dehydrogenase [Nocardia fluminea]|uniref:3-(cis-5,6-dihydroxycyclohexa-1, 3-dien-1-yl)propanoate dehydrogenase n=1 Tax=Nocardia fluminea TaxID=134984 RepID=UPI0033DFC6B9